MKKLKNICPMTFLNPNGPAECCKDQCHWWQVYYEGKENEYAECAIKSLSCLQDMV